MMSNRTSCEKSYHSKGGKNKGKKKKKEQKLRVPAYNGEADAWLSGEPVVCGLNYRQLSGVSLWALKNLEPCQREI